MDILTINNLSKCFDMKAKKRIYAVKDIDLHIKEGEALGLVGESGCGKSTLAKLILQLERPTEGEVIYKDEDLVKKKFRQMQEIRNELQMVFQNSANMFNPYFTVKQIIMEPINDKTVSKEEKEKMIVAMLEKLGLDESFVNRYGNELSGGQRQRVGIARALISQPRFVVCDEAVSSLDYIIKKQILDLLLSLKEQMGLTYLFISHDLSSVKRVCDRVVVMYLGKIVEILPRLDEDARHPYTKALLAASLDIDPRNRTKQKVLYKEHGEKSIPKEGCIFQYRCLYANDECRSKRPELKGGDGDHLVACHLCRD